MRNVYLVHNSSTEHYDKGFSYPGHNPIRLFMTCLSTEVVPSSGFYDTRWWASSFSVFDHKSEAPYERRITEGLFYIWRKELFNFPSITEIEVFCWKIMTQVLHVTVVKIAFLRIGTQTDRHMCLKWSRVCAQVKPVHRGDEVIITKTRLYNFDPL